MLFTKSYPFSKLWLIHKCLNISIKSSIEKWFHVFSFKGFIITLLSASVLGQNPADLDYDYEAPAQSGGRREVPVFVNVYNHPKTGFSCADKQAGQYYADPETKCAVYYVCIPNAQNTLIPQSFACPNGTIFSQSTRVCASHEQGLNLSIFSLISIRFRQITYWLIFNLI